MPTHVDDISVFLEKACGAAYEEYPNSHEKRHHSFYGGFASRIITALPGERCSAVVSFGPKFKLFDADGVVIIISIGDETEQLGYHANTQTFWLDANYIKNNRVHNFQVFTTWEVEGSTEPTRRLPLQTPRLDPAYATAGTEWQVHPTVFQANKGCVSVCVIRGYLPGKITQPYTITDPPSAWRLMDTGMPKVIDGFWIDYHEEEGHEYIFEFRNMPADSIDPGQPEARPLFGHRDHDRRAEKFFGADEDWDDRSGTWGEADYENATDFEAFHSTHNKRKAADSRTCRKRRRTLNSTAANACIAGGASGSTAMAGSSAQGQPTCEDPDDEEELPTLRESEIKQEQGLKQDARRTQTMTPPPEGIPDRTRAMDQAIDLTADDDEILQIKTEPGPAGDLGDEDEEYFELQMKKARIERDYQLKKAEIESKRRACLRKKQAGGGG